jgi:protein N-lysine methyltransferase METTL21A
MEVFSHVKLQPVASLSNTRTMSRGERLAENIVAAKPDIILAADCVYFEPAFPLLLATLSDLLSLCPTAEVFFCFKKRRRADMRFLKDAQKAFHVVEIPDEDRPEFSRQGLFLYSFKNKTQTT